MLLLALFSLWLGLQPQPEDSLSPAILAVEQSEYYLQQIQDDHQTELHLWALANLCENRQHPVLLNTINDNVRSITELNDLEQPFCRDQSLHDHLQERVQDPPDVAEEGVRALLPEVGLDEVANQSPAREDLVDALADERNGPRPGRRVTECGRRLTGCGHRGEG